MRTSRAILVTSCVLLAAAWARGGDSDDLTLLAMAPTGDLAKEFASPPGAARPWVYWFWLDGNINREGITADLEAMKRAGIGGVLIMEVDQGTPAGPVPFGSPAWRELFTLRLLRGPAAGAGSEHEQRRRLVRQRRAVDHARVVDAEGGLDRDARGRPAAIRGDPCPSRRRWRISTATSPCWPCPSPPATRWNSPRLSPKVTTSDGQAVEAKTLFDRNTPTAMTLPRPDAGKPQYVQFELKEPMTARSLSLTIQGGAGDITTRGALQVSQDGRTFRTVCEFAGPPGVVTLDFPEVSARFFRILFTEERPGSTGWGWARWRLPRATASKIFKARRPSSRSTWWRRPAGRRRRPGVAIPRGQIVDLTAAMDPNGRLTWDVPPGKWLLLRLGHTTTGMENHPAPLGGLGLECDKLSKEAAEAHFNGLMGKLIADAGPLAGQGKTLVSTHIDSWETGSQNWTPRMREEFRRRRGYDLLPLLPVLTGRVVDSREVSERFLWDLRQTVSDLLVENYAGHLRRLAHRHGLRLSIEAYDDVPCDEMAYAGAGRRADGRVLVVGEVRRGLQLHGDVLGGPHLRQTHPRRRGVYGQRRREMAGPPGRRQGPGRLGVLRGDQPLRVPPLRHAAVAGPPARHVHGTLGAALRTDRDLVGPLAALARVSRPLPVPAAQGLFVADICYLQPEGAPRRFTPHDSAPACRRWCRRRWTFPPRCIGGPATTSTAARRKSF